MRWVVLAAAVLLTGCAAQRQAQMEADARAAIAVCHATIPATQGNHAKLAYCVIDAYTNAGFNSPAQNLLNATRLSLAEQMDAGSITQAEAQMRYADTVYQVQQDAAAAQQARAANAAAILATMPRPQPYVAPVPYMPIQRPWTASCMQMAPGAVSCSGN